MSKVFDSNNNANLEYSSIDSSQIISPPEIKTGFADMGETSSLKTGVWVHPVGISTDVEVDEVFVVIEGRGRIILKDGKILQLFPGAVGTLHSGEETRWEIDETLKKVWVVSK